MLRTHLSRSTIALAGIFGTALALAVVACLIPDNPYLRFQLLKNTDGAQAQWIYERIHFDSRPFDVVFSGPSRTMVGVSSSRIQEDLRRLGSSASVVNFSLPETGRNLDYVIIKELFKTDRRPKLLVLGVIEKPSRFGHSKFKYLSDSSDVVEAAYPINLHYFADLSYLPFRQMKLAAMWLFPGTFNVDPQFDPASYQGSDYDITMWIRLRDRVVPRAKLLKDAGDSENGFTPPLLPAAAADIEFGDENFYIRKIVAMARARRVRVAFLYIPYFTGPPTTLEEAFYAQFGPILNANFVSDKDQLFMDYAHLNHAGAVELSDWLAERIASLLSGNDPNAK
jgi:hypothetical protein